ncbi:GrdX family protein [Halanaerobium praevalens]|uniref:Glycine reductase complex component n=1 Tax=Halanaerobium praevalens (strain ATCC 33744 / DSM 2228 / GSL) TaxID=572479 RepID=E3DNX8_HALPG|nr:GrdX family protein [Halanaerobium praevalens]ADO76602.1 putative glycine reductase complex component [Halanaerobium praevalens DSM 2228]
MQDPIIITNNPQLKKRVKKIELEFVDDLFAVYSKSRDLIHQNWKLISHPLAGSVKPAQNPYRSIILAPAKKLDFYSLKTIERAIQKLKQFNQNHKKREYSQKIKEDYQIIDLTLIDSALKNKKLV